MKTTTDIHWNERAASVKNDIEVNIMDIFQRELEYDAICRYLTPDMRVLEVGCGNGFSTRRFREHAAWVDAFDYAENMVDRARATVGEENNRFFHDNVLGPSGFDSPYDAVICVRVLINLAGLDDQRRAVGNMTDATRPGGLLILAEGFTEGFEHLNGIRASVGLPSLEPAAINFYSSVDDLRPAWEASFDVEDTFHLGAYDYLTRVVYPQMAGADNVKHNSVFSERSAQLARAFNPECFAHLSRMRGYVLRRR